MLDSFLTAYQNGLTGQPYYVQARRIVEDRCLWRQWRSAQRSDVSGISSDAVPVCNGKSDAIPMCGGWYALVR